MNLSSVSTHASLVSLSNFGFKYLLVVYLDKISKVNFIYKSYMQGRSQHGARGGAIAPPPVEVIAPQLEKSFCCTVYVHRQ